MAKKKRHRGHYCKVCNSILSNEKFTGGGHSRHICKRCSKLTVEERKEMSDINRIYNLYRFPNLSKSNRKMLERYLDNKSEKVREVAKAMIDEFSEVARLIRMADEEYEEMMGIDPGNDEFLDDDEDDVYMEDLHKIDGHFDWYSDEEYDDELPF